MRVNRRPLKSEEKSIGTLYRSSLPPLPSRRHQAVPEGHQVLYRQVRHREAQFCPRPAWPGPQSEDRGYGLQLREKQKARRIYFTLEGQFREYYEKASRAQGVTGELLLQQLERRLDNVAFRLGFATSRRQARQIVRHGHVEVNGRKVNIPSFQVSVGDEIKIRPNSQKLTVLETSREFASHQPLRHGSRSTMRICRARCCRCRSAKTSTCRSTSS